MVELTNEVLEREEVITMPDDTLEAEKKVESPRDSRDGQWRTLSVNTWGCGRPGGFVEAGIPSGRSGITVKVYLDPQGGTENKPIRDLVKVDGGLVLTAKTKPGSYDQQMQEPEYSVNRENFRQFQPVLARANILVQSVTGNETQQRSDQDFQDLISQVDNAWFKAFDMVSGAE